MKTPFAILNDTTLCTGCEKCVEACRRENNLGKDEPRRWKRGINDLSSTRYTTILRHRDKEKSKIRFVRQQCRHCVDPACVSACLVGALTKTNEGPVTYDQDKCIGCRYCMLACPYGIPRYDWEEPVPYIRKCNMCYERITDDKKGDEDRKPVCVLECPHEATLFGNRDELIRKAHDRIRDNPGRYLDKVFGEFEVGGTSVIYLSDVPLDSLALKRESGDEPELGNQPLPELTLAALSKVPPLIVGMSTFLTGVWWIIGRRVKLAREQQTSNCEEENPAVSEAAPSSEIDQENSA